MFSHDLPWRRWIPIFVAVGAIGLLIALLLPAIQQAREAARKSESRNNLKQLGLALHNYHDTHRCFPPGGVVRADAVAFHGWFVQIMPFIDNGPLYHWTNKNEPWDDPENTRAFRKSLSVALIPGALDIATSDGYGLLHYMANPNILHRNSHVGIRDLTDGTANTWLAGEVAGNYQPWGYPYNWRPLGTQLNSSRNDYGRPSGDGAFLLMGDGAAKFFDNDSSPIILKNLANAPPIPRKEDVLVPIRFFECEATEWRRVRVPLDNVDVDGPFAFARLDPFGRPDSVEIDGYKGARGSSHDDLLRVVAAYPDMQKLYGAPPIDDDVAVLLSKLENLELLSAESIEVSVRGIQDLRRLPKLRILCTEELEHERLDRLRAALPKCAIRVKRVLP
jgi:hypothetical protein